jgi:nucleoside-diphosphate-sugar epimerase
VSREILNPILISGGSGYLASHLINSCLNDEIIIIDRTFKKNRINRPIKAIIEKPLEDLILEDIPEPINCLIHASYCKNIETEKIFLKLVKERNPNIEVIFFSSSAVYGDLKKEIFTVKDKENPINDYGRYKLELEKFIKGEFENYKILRIANPYGKEFEQKGVYQLFKNKILKSLETNYQVSFTINYPQAGVMTRDMIYIDLAINQIKEVLKISERGIFNIASGQGICLEDFAYLALNDFCEEFNFDSKLFKLNFTYREKPDGEIVRSILEPRLYELSPQDSYCS